VSYDQSAAAVVPVSDDLDDVRATLAARCEACFERINDAVSELLALHCVGADEILARLPLALLALATAVAIGVPGANAAPSFSGPFSVLGGTWVSNGKVVGKAFALETLDPSLHVIVTGPGSAFIRMGGQHPPGSPSSFSFYWCLASPKCPGGDGNFSASSRTSLTTVPVAFDIHAASRLGDVEITGVKLTREYGLVRWSAPVAARSFYVFIKRLSVGHGDAYHGNAYDVLKSHVLAGRTRSASFNGLRLDAGASYAVRVFAFSIDIRSSAFRSGHFNVSSTGRDLQPTP
jgi:hypothetical protein